MSNKPEAVEPSTLVTVRGGAGQAELRTMARNWCPAAYAKYKNQSTLTRKMGEVCLEEAGFGAYKSQLDRYFPKTGGGS